MARSVSRAFNAARANGPSTRQSVRCPGTPRRQSRDPVRDLRLERDGVGESEESRYGDCMALIGEAADRRSQLLCVRSTPQQPRCTVGKRPRGESRVTFEAGFTEHDLTGRRMTGRIVFADTEALGDGVSGGYSSLRHS